PFSVSPGSPGSCCLSVPPDNRQKSLLQFLPPWLDLSECPGYFLSPFPLSTLSAHSFCRSWWWSSGGDLFHYMHNSNALRRSSPGHLCRSSFFRTFHKTAFR